MRTPPKLSASPLAPGQPPMRVMHVPNLRAWGPPGVHALGATFKATVVMDNGFTALVETKVSTPESRINVTNPTSLEMMLPVNVGGKLRMEGCAVYYDPGAARFQKIVGSIDGLPVPAEGSLDPFRVGDVTFSTQGEPSTTAPPCP